MGPRLVPGNSTDELSFLTPITFPAHSLSADLAGEEVIISVSSQHGCDTRSLVKTWQAQHLVSMDAGITFQIAVRLPDSSLSLPMMQLLTVNVQHATCTTVCASTQLVLTLLPSDASVQTSLLSHSATHLDAFVKHVLQPFAAMHSCLDVGSDSCYAPSHTASLGIGDLWPGMCIPLTNAESDTAAFDAGVLDVSFWRCVGMLALSSGDAALKPCSASQQSGKQLQLPPEKLRCTPSIGFVALGSVSAAAMVVANWPWERRGIAMLHVRGMIPSRQADLVDHLYGQGLTQQQSTQDGTLFFVPFLDDYVPRRNFTGDRLFQNLSEAALARTQPSPQTPSLSSVQGVLAAALPAGTKAAESFLRVSGGCIVVLPPLGSKTQAAAAADRRRKHGDKAVALEQATQDTFIRSSPALGRLFPRRPLTHPERTNLGYAWAVVKSARAIFDVHEDFIMNAWQLPGVDMLSDALSITARTPVAILEGTSASTTTPLAANMVSRVLPAKNSILQPRGFPDSALAAQRDLAQSRRPQLQVSNAQLGIAQSAIAGHADVIT